MTNREREGWRSRTNLIALFGHACANPALYTRQSFPVQYGRRDTAVASAWGSSEANDGDRGVCLYKYRGRQVHATSYSILSRSRRRDFFIFIFFFIYFLLVGDHTSLPQVNTKR